MELDKSHPELSEEEPKRKHKNKQKSSPWEVVPEKKQRGDIHVPRHCVASGVFNNLMIIFGGVVPEDHRKEYGSKKFNDVYSFDVKTKIWKEVLTVGDTPSKRYCHTGTVLKNSFVVFGGLSVSSDDPSDGGRRDDVCVYSLNLEDLGAGGKCTWVKLDLMSPPQARSHHAAAAYGNDKLIIFGGIVETGARVNDVHILDLEKKIWTPVLTTGEPPVNRLASQIVVWQNKLVLFGGYTGSVMGKLNDVHLLDLNTQTWSSPKTTGLPPTGRYGHTCVLLGNKLVLYGGMDTQKKGGTDLYVLDLEHMEWLKLPSSPQDDQYPYYHYYHSASVTSDNNIVIYGNRVDCSVLILETDKTDVLRTHSLDEAKNKIRENFKKLTLQGKNDKTIEKLVNESLNLLKSQFNRLLEEEHKIQNQSEDLHHVQQKLESANKKVEKYQTNIPMRVKLNIGGIKYETTRSTLMGEQGSMLHAMFSGNYDVKPDEEGFIFIDRDGNYFGYVLNYLRNRTVFLPEDDKVLLLNLKQEAEYFQLEGLLMIIRKYLGEDYV